MSGGQNLKESTMSRLTQRTVVLLAAVLLLPTAGAMAQSATESEVRERILESNRHSLETGLPYVDGISAEGTVEFWSSGGLMQKLSPGGEPEGWEVYNVHPKHIKVIPLVEGQAAVAMYYAEGSMKPKGAPMVDHYLTRVTEVYVKEDGEWKVRAAHYSPIAGGSGTSQTAE